MCKVQTAQENLKNCNKPRNNPQLLNEQALSVGGNGKQLTHLLSSSKKKLKNSSAPKSKVLFLTQTPLRNERE